MALENRLENPLRNHNHYNYIITLGVLTRQEHNNPNTYRTNGFSSILLRSGGGALDKRIQTDAEIAIGYRPGQINPSDAASFGIARTDAEYFIEDLEIDAVIAPNSNTGIAVGTNISFKVVEPYSMGKFLEAVQIAAKRGEFKNNNQIPFGLQIEFVGWDNAGVESQTYVGQPAFIPIIITKMDFAVSEQGSTYDVQAVAYNDTAMEDNTDSLKVDISCAGDSVANLLQNQEYTSLAETINRRYETLEEEGIIPGYDNYLILFPNNLEEIIEQIVGAQDDARLSAESGPLQGPTVNGEPLESGSIGEIYTRLKDWGRANVNEIGKSIITEELSDGRTTRFEDAADAMTEDGLTDPNIDGVGELMYMFPQGTAITSIIEEVVLSSQYATVNAQRTDDSGFRDWFRIRPMVFIEDTSADIESRLGRKIRTYVYAVYPYRTHEARHLIPGQSPRGIEELKRQAQKEYDYIYTGGNEDVLDFNINFNYAYFLPAVLASDQESLNGSSRANISVSNAKVAADRGATVDSRRTNESGQILAEAGNREVGTVGTSPALAQSVEKRIAQLFHNRLVNSNVDMITAEIDIWGDPYFLPSDIGNYTTTPSGNYLTNEGTMPYLQTDIHVIVNFRTPIDYKDDITGLMEFADSEIGSFSGLFQVWAATNSFSQGMFKQNLKLIRVTNQNADPTTNNTNAIEPNIASITPSSDASGNPVRILRTVDNREIILPGPGGPPPALPTGEPG